jgi:hypothetical protein
MDSTRAFRRHLLHRLLIVFGAAASAGGCGGTAVKDGSPAGSEGGGGQGGAQQGPGPGQGGTQQGPGPGPGPGPGGGAQPGTVQCFPWPQGTVASTTSTGAAPPPPPLACPTKDEAIAYLGSGGCITVLSEGTYQQGQCCYLVSQTDCLTGRPYLAEGEAVTAPPSGERDARRWTEAKGAAPSLAGLSSEARETLAALWLGDGLGEHASVASFGRFALELLAAGAPPELVAKAHEAALDEVRHARACLRLAAAYAGRAVGPGAFPFHGAVPVATDLADIAARAALEGCVGETLAAVVAVEQLAVATDPAVRDVLAMIAREEAAHAELAWRAVAWAMARGGEPVRRAVARALEEGMRALVDDVRRAPRERDEALARHGRLDVETTRAARRRAVEEVVRPAAERLFAGEPWRPADAAAEIG